MKRIETLGRHYDVVVVGARCAGAATAMLLAQQGARVLVIDRDEPSKDTMSTHALMRGGVMQLSRWGLLPALKEAGTPEVRETSFYYGPMPLTLPIKPSHGVEYLIAPRRYVLDTTLANAAQAAGAEMRCNISFQAAIRNEEGTVTGAQIRDCFGQTHRVTSDLLIGADGRQSTVARRVKASTDRLSTHASACVYAYFDGLKDHGYRWYYAPGLTAGVIPTNDGKSCVFVSMPQAVLRQRRCAARPDQIIGDACAEIDLNLGRELATARIDTRAIVYGGQAGHMRRAYGPGWALVGDAGYFKDPNTAHGLTDALRDAELLAVNYGRHGHAGLAEYQSIRDMLSRELFEITDEIASFAWDMPKIQSLHLRLNDEMKREQDWMESGHITAAIAA